MKCPYCDQEMQHGEIIADPRSGLFFLKEGEKRSFWEQMAGVGRIEAAKGGWAKLKVPADYCERCKKMIFDTAISK